MTERSITARRSRLGERLLHVAGLLSVLVPLGLLAILVGDVVSEGISRLDWDFITGIPSRRAARAGIWPALVGSLYLIGLTALLAVPIGVGAAVYLEEYRRDSSFAAILEINIANLAGVPSVIYGLLGLDIFVRVLGLGASLLAGACTLALLVLPLIIVSTREALRAVPDSLREASMALGATRWQMVRQVVVPMALPGILTGVILAVSRAIGETAPLIVIGAVVFITFAPEGLDSPFTALPLQIFNWVSMPQQDFLANAAAAIVVLLVTMLLVNALAIFLRNRYQRRFDI